MKDLDKLIELEEKKVGLLKKLKESLEYEDCKYHVVQPESTRQFFMLFEIATQQEVRAGNAQYIRTWLERRSIPNEQVYGYELIKYVEPVKLESTGFYINGRITKRLEW